MLLPSSCVYSRPLTTSLLKKGDGPNAESLKSEFFFFGSLPPAGHVPLCLVQFVCIVSSHTVWWGTCWETSVLILVL